MGALSHILRIFFNASSALGSLSFRPSRFSALRSLYGSQPAGISCSQPMVRVGPGTLAPGGGTSPDKAGWTCGTVSRTVSRTLCATAWPVSQSAQAHSPAFIMVLRFIPGPLCSYARRQAVGQG